MGNKKCCDCKYYDWIHSAFSNCRFIVKEQIKNEFNGLIMQKKQHLNIHENNDGDCKHFVKAKWYEKFSSRYKY